MDSPNGPTTPVVLGLVPRPSPVMGSPNDPTTPVILGLVPRIGPGTFMPPDANDPDRAIQPRSLIRSNGKIGRRTCLKSRMS
jgi:hypothetical protein